MTSQGNVKKVAISPIEMKQPEHSADSLSAGIEPTGHLCTARTARRTSDPRRFATAIFQPCESCHLASPRTLRVSRSTGRLVARYRRGVYELLALSSSNILAGRFASLLREQVDLRALLHFGNPHVPPWPSERPLVAT